MTTQVIRNHIEAILAFLEPHRNFINCHMVNYLTDNHWEKFIPANVRKNVASDDMNEIIEDVFWNQQRSEKYREIFTFLEQAKKYRLEYLDDVITTKEELNRMLLKSGKSSSVSIKEFMSEKKCHEVEITAELIADLIGQKDEPNFIIIDAGDGKGYLSSRLALQYGLKVLGIDANESNTENAIERSKKLERAWNGLTKRADLISKGITPPRRGKKSSNSENAEIPQKTPNPENYKTLSKFITPDLDFGEEISDLFPGIDTENCNFCLTGLHTCGNLASTCLKVFTASSDFKILCNIGCCYHLLNEEFSQNEFFGNKEIMCKNSDNGFPLSDFLRTRNFKLGRNARMLAAQSIHRTIAGKDLPNRTLFYRALLEVLIVKENGAAVKDATQVGKIKKCSNFAEYVIKCDRKMNLGLMDIYSEAELCGIESQYVSESKFLDLFYLLRMSFAPIIETVILLDRLLYLNENSINECYLVPLFDPVISPRCFCIVALK